MTKFIIVRHGYSVANKEKRFAGQLDIDLDERGLAQAQSVADYIVENFKVDSIYSSDLIRTVKTVKPTAEKLGLEVNKCTELREVDVGFWQGKLFEEIEKEYPENFELYKKTPGLCRFDGGENYSDCLYRTKDLLDKLAEENEGKTIVIGTHGGVIRTLRAYLKNIPMSKLQDLPHVPNASITIVEYNNGEIKLVEEGYAEHLLDITAEAPIK